MIVFNFPIEPVAKGRPRFGRGRTYTPKKTKDFESAIKLMATTQYRSGPMAGALSMHVVFYIKRPKTVKREYPVVKPDCSNLVKGVEDALNGVAYIDDSQIVDLSVHKRYSDTPMIIVTIGGCLDGSIEKNF